jgi:hypothetical protein
MAMFNTRAIAALIVAPALAVTVACSGNASLSPTGPSGVGSPSGSGASITGQVNGGSGLAGMSVNGAPAAATSTNVTVSITGTGIAAAADAQGRFTLTGVPAGPVQLHFTGPGIDATATLEVGAGEQITIAVTVSGSNATIESRRGAGGIDGKVELEGRITAIDVALSTIQVSGVVVNVPPTAVIRKAGGTPLLFADLLIGDRVHVRGTRVTGGGVDALEVKVQSQNTNPPLKLEGMVEGLTGTCPDVDFMIGGSLVETDGSTYFKGGACADLADGDNVEVRARVVAGKIVASQVETEDDDEEDEEDDEEEKQGGSRGRGGRGGA